MFTYHTDPGHGWLEVSAADLKAVGLTAKDFSAYSYRGNGKLYLEEDCDASKFVAAYEAKHGRKAEYQERYAERSFIRRLPSNG